MTPWNDAKVEWKAPQKHWYGWPLIVIRMFLLVLVTLIGFGPLLIVQAIQAVIGRRAWEVKIQLIWARIVMAIFGMRLKIEGSPTTRGGAVVGNHSSWLDILIFSAASGGFFVSKAEVKKWPIIGQVASLLRTEFLIRDPKYSAQQVDRLRARYALGDRIVFFPEGTTTDGLHIIPFKSSLFESLADAEAKPSILTMTIFYDAPEGASPNFYGLWGEMDFLEQVFSVMKVWRHKPIKVVFKTLDDVERDRRVLRDSCEAIIRDNHARLMREAGLGDMIEELPQACVMTLKELNKAS